MKIITLLPLVILLVLPIAELILIPIPTPLDGNMSVQRFCGGALSKEKVIFGILGGFKQIRIPSTLPGRRILAGEKSLKE